MLQQFHALDLDADVSLPSLHRSGYSALALDAIERRYLLAGTHSGHLGIYDVQSLALPLPLLAQIRARGEYGHQALINDVQWFPLDTGLFVSSDMRGLVKVWDTNRAVVVEQFAGFRHVFGHGICVTPSGSCLVAIAGGDKHVHLCDIRSGARTHSLAGHTRAVLALQWSPANEHLLVTGSRDNTIRLWDVRKARAMLTQLDMGNDDQASLHARTSAPAHSGHVNGLTFSSDGQTLVSTCCVARQIHTWDMRTLRRHLTVFSGIKPSQAHTRRMRILESAGRPYLLYPNASDLVLYDLWDGGAPVRTMRGHYHPISCLVADEAAPYVITGSGDPELLTWRPYRPEGPAEARDEFQLPHHLPIALDDEDNWSEDEEPAPAPRAGGNGR
ncbi:uncharacterized protein MONBRDRAFT_13732 [Monosiga brevicollis MX1]|uniref:Uncharacterized protein n=1 Tax=Monosiga brevicollis TaxID=81824 RepID=A9UQK1_MONBE|nr:uncharacterized protein MONBRDRAFT_13732 [Monosiga brevicollis MX1]EDQ92612.1 predicted protein [Monosiga brevicollis MX1]|eukprot:XP_001742374.1 hypothetical protein [Monosiga brevicollis MX1]